MTVTPFDITWSHSSLNMFLECPHKYYRVRISKDFPFQETEAIREGNRIHRELELAVVNLSKEGKFTFQKKDEWLREYADMAASAPNVSTEKELALTSALTSCSWFSRTEKVWARCKVDVLSIDDHGTATVWDWKTGKYWGPDQQDKRTAMFLFWYYPQVQTVHTNWVYMKPPEVSLEERNKTATFTREKDHLPIVGETMRTLQGVAKATNNDKWEKTPGNGCRFCEVRDCQFQGRKM